MATASIESQSQIESSTASKSRRTLYIAILALVWLAIYVVSLQNPPLLDDADTVHAEAARMMLVRHEWVTLYIDGNVSPVQSGLRYLEKAPLQYWATAICYKLFGISEWTTRLPLALTALGLALFLLYFGGKLYGPTHGEAAGFNAGLILLTSFGVYLFTRFFIPDLIIGLWITLAMFFFLRSLDEVESKAGVERGAKPSRISCWGFAAICALAVLTKGLIGIVFPLGAVFFYLLLTGNLKHLLRLRLMSSTLVFLAIAAPWHVLAGLLNPPAGQAKGFLWFYFVNEHFKRFLGTRYPKDYDTVPLLLFWGLALVWLLPWSAFLPEGLAQIPARVREWRTGLDQCGRANLLFGIWALLIFLFFSFSTRQEYYVVPTFPALALLIGGWMGREAESPEDSGLRRSGRISSVVLLALGVLIFVVTMALVALSKPPLPATDIATLLAEHPQDYALSMGHFLDLTPQALGAFRVPLAGTGIAFLLGTFFNWRFRRRARCFAANLSLAAMMVAFLYCAHLGFMLFSPVMSSKPLALAIASQYRPGDVIVINGEYEAGSSINFYTGEQVHILDHVNGNIWYGSLFPDAPPVFETNDSFKKLWRSPARVFFWTQMADIPTELLTSPEYSVAQGGGKVVLSNQPDR